MKKIVLSIITVILITLSFNAVTYADITEDEQKAIQSVDITEYMNSLFYYDVSVEFIAQVKNDNLRNRLMTKLLKVAPSVYTEEIKNILDNMKLLSKNPNPNTYNNIKTMIINSGSLIELDRKYLLGELESWGLNLIK